MFIDILKVYKNFYAFKDFCHFSAESSFCPPHCSFRKCSAAGVNWQEKGNACQVPDIEEVSREHRLGFGPPKRGGERETDG